MLQPDTILQERYQIIKKLGSGGMGTVYLASDTRLRNNKKVAIKASHNNHDKNVNEAFTREATLLAKLNHSALTKVFDFFSDDYEMFLVMEYVEGTTLQSALRDELKQNQRPIHHLKVLDWLKQILSALDYLHNFEPSILHQDIKPGNIMVTDSGRIVLVDFGLAKTKQLNEPSYKSLPGFTPTYASLEQIDQSSIDPRSDLYSLAATGYELLCGEPPREIWRRFRGLSTEADAQLDFDSEYFSSIPQELVGILKSAFSVNKEDRPDSAREMLQLLNDITVVANSENISTIAVETSAATEILKQPAEETKPAQTIPQTIKSDLTKENLQSICSNSASGVLLATDRAKFWLEKLAKEQSSESAELYIRLSKEASETARNLMIVAERADHIAKSA